MKEKVFFDNSRILIEQVCWCHLLPNILIFFDRDYKNKIQAIELAFLFWEFRIYFNIVEKDITEKDIAEKNITINDE